MQKNERFDQTGPGTAEAMPAAQSSMQTTSVVLSSRKSDPSAAVPGGEHYPVPGVYEHKIKARDYDPL